MSHGYPQICTPDPPSILTAPSHSLEMDHLIFDKGIKQYLRRVNHILEVPGFPHGTLGTSLD